LADEDRPNLDRIHNEYIGRKLNKRFFSGLGNDEVLLYEGTVTDEGDDIDGKYAVYVDYGDYDAEVMSVDDLIPLLLVSTPTFEYQKAAESTEAIKKDDDMRFELCTETESVPDDLRKKVSVLSHILLLYKEDKYKQHLMKEGRDPLEDLLLRFQQRGWDMICFIFIRWSLTGCTKKAKPRIWSCFALTSVITINLLCDRA
jgi:hypothetical protein